jgi:hypothetical protein
LDNLVVTYLLKIVTSFDKEHIVVYNFKSNSAFAYEKKKQNKCIAYKHMNSSLCCFCNLLRKIWQLKNNETKCIRKEEKQNKTNWWKMKKEVKKEKR